jgi:hypothetical protein
MRGKIVEKSPILLTDHESSQHTPNKEENKLFVTSATISGILMLTIHNRPSLRLGNLALVLFTPYFSRHSSPYLYGTLLRGEQTRKSQDKPHLKILNRQEDPDHQRYESGHLQVHYWPLAGSALSSLSSIFSGGIAVHSSGAEN